MHRAAHFVHAPESQHPVRREAHHGALRELLATDIEGVESIGAVGAGLKQVLLGLLELLAALVLLEAVAPAQHARRLYGKYQVVVVLPVEERHEPLLARKRLVDEQVLLGMAHGVAHVHVDHLPTVQLKLMLHHPAEVLVVDGIV